MEQYTIYCTKKQTKKAFELGAPIITISEPLYNHPTCGRDWVKVEVQGNSYSAQIPTTEQMIGWLEERDVYIHTEAVAGWWHYYVTNSVEYIKWETANLTRKEATLAAIDAALDYLIGNIK